MEKGRWSSFDHLSWHCQIS